MFFIAFVFLCATFAYGQEPCLTPKGDTGTCIPLNTCAPLLDLIRNLKKNETYTLFLRQSRCGLLGNPTIKVCCPLPSTPQTVTNAPTTLSVTGTSVVPQLPSLGTVCPSTASAPNPDSLCCGQQTYIPTSDKIVGGRITAIDQFPWLALLEYDFKGKTGCGGSLISARYVLTAAHCLGRTAVGTATKVRLAEFDTSTFPTDKVVDEGGLVAITVVVIDIQKQIKHPDYKTGPRESRNDIGLVRLARDAAYTDFIRPICLPDQDFTLKTKRKNPILYTAGWGFNGTTASTVKQYVQIPYVPHIKCQESHNRFANSKLNHNHICAGGELGKDSCKGDSGGPLMLYEEDTYFVVGVVSFGPKACGFDGVPGAYTDVFKYVDWLRSEMK